MGQVYEVCCPDCGYRFEFSQGCAMFDCTEEGREWHKQKIAAGDLGEDPKRILDRHPDAWVSYARQLLYCETCNQYANRSDYRIYRSGRSDALLYASRHICTKCHHPMRMIEEGALTSPPSCFAHAVRVAHV